MCLSDVYSTGWSHAGGFTWHRGNESVQLGDIAGVTSLPSPTDIVV